MILNKEDLNLSALDYVWGTDNLAFSFYPILCFCKIWRKNNIWVFKSETLSWNPGPMSF